MGEGAGGGSGVPSSSGPRTRCWGTREPRKRWSFASFSLLRRRSSSASCSDESERLSDSSRRRPRGPRGVSASTSDSPSSPAPSSSDRSMNDRGDPGPSPTLNRPVRTLCPSFEGTPSAVPISITDDASRPSLLSAVDAVVSFDRRPTINENSSGLSGAECRRAASETYRVPSGGGQTISPAEPYTGVTTSSDIDTAGRWCWCLRFAVRFSAVRFPGIGMQPFAKCVSFDSGDTGDTPGVCPKTCVSLCVVRTRCARSRGVSAFVVDSPRSRSDANELSELPCLACAWDVLFGLLAE